MKRGLFITFEGADAAGKTTQVKLLEEYISKKHSKDKVLFIHEPGGTALGEEIRNLLLHFTQDVPTNKAELLLFLASRAQICEKVIEPALKEGKIVIADRFYDSTIAYQGFARGIFSGEEILSLNKLIIGDLKPDLTFYLKISATDAMKRKRAMKEELDRFEKEKSDFHQKVCAGYDFISQKESERFYIIDATRSIEDIHNEIVKIIEEKRKN